jgi:secreted trypsin-like serine protease
VKSRFLVAGLLMAVTTAASPVLPAASAAPPAERGAEGFITDRFIIGGHDATESYSFMASMQHAGTGAHRCGAALLAPRWLVTAGHCVSAEDPSKYQYRIGSADRTSGGELVTPEAFLVHPGYDLLQGRDDIALVRLSQPVKAAPTVIAADSPRGGSDTRIIGWGLTCPVRGCGNPPVTLQEMDTSVADQQACTGIVPFNPDHDLCVGDNNSATGACFGDSGSPALAKVNGGWQIVGVTSRAQSFVCAMLAAIYTNATTYTGWINEHINARVVYP